MNATQQKNRIESVTVEKIPDDDADSSYLGTYNNEVKNEYAIDRQKRGDMGRNEFRWFNPSVERYDSLAPRTIRRYCLEDYKRAERLNAGDWCYIGIRAKAEVVSANGICHTLSSGGVWGIESDSDKSYFKDVAREELVSLQAELGAFGFSAEQIAEAFASVDISNF